MRLYIIIYILYKINLKKSPKSREQSKTNASLFQKYFSSYNTQKKKKKLCGPYNLSIFQAQYNPSKLSSLYSFFHFTLKPSIQAATPPPPPPPLRLNPPCQRNGEHYNTVTVTHTTPSFSQTRTPSLYSQLSKPTHRRNSTLN